MTTKQRWRQIVPTGLIGIAVPPLLLIIVLSTFVLGGGSRVDIVSLLLLRPLAVFLLAAALYLHGGRALANSPWLLFFAALVTLLAVLHVVPLPPALWSGLPGRDVVMATFRDLEEPLPWLPFTLTPARGWNALFALAAPLGALVSSLACTRRQHRDLAKLIVVLVLVSGILGLLQVTGRGGGPLYLYSVTNETAAVGLFANRNHNALFLGTALPILAMFWNSRDLPAQRLRLRRALLIGVGILIVPMILLTGSRGGLVTGAIGAAGAIFIAWTGRGTSPAVQLPARRGERSVELPRIVVVGALATALLAVLLVIVMRSASFQRFTETDPAQEMRLTALPVICDAVLAYLPLGSGAGSFDGVFRSVEPDAAIGPQYLNHAHNDWLETLLTHGLPGAALMAGAVVLFMVGLARVLRSRRGAGKVADRPLALAGATIISMIAALSLFDYPLRVPSIGVTLALAAAWLALGGRRSGW